MKKIILMLIALCFTMAACAAPPEPLPAEKGNSSKITEIPELGPYSEIVETEVTLEDGRKITCLVYSGAKQGGLHCLEPREQ